MLNCVPVENPCVQPTFPLKLFEISQFDQPVTSGLNSGVLWCAQLISPEMDGSYCGIAGPVASGIAPATDRSFCCWVISATSEKFVFTAAAGVELEVRVVSSGPFGPPIPGGGSSTSRLNPRS